MQHTPACTIGQAHLSLVSDSLHGNLSKALTNFRVVLCVNVVYSLFLLGLAITIVNIDIFYVTLFNSCYLH